MSQTIKQRRKYTMLEYTYDEVSGRLWSDHFEGFCTGLRDLCGLDVDVNRSSASMATYYQEYRIGGEKCGVERDDMPKFLADHGIANNLTRSRANPNNWVLYLTEQEGMVEKFEELFRLDKAQSSGEALVTTEVVINTEVLTSTEIIADTDEDTTEKDAGIEGTTSETKEEAEDAEVESESEVVSEDLVSTEIVSEEEEKDEDLQPDFDYVKSLKEKEYGEDLLKEYGKAFGIEVTGKNFKGCYISFCNKWKRIQKAKA